MPTYTDPAPCAEGEDLYECRDCQTRLCSEQRLTACPQCEGRMVNLSKPRAE